MRRLLRRLEYLESRKAFEPWKPWHICNPRDRGGSNECLDDACPLGEKPHTMRCMRVCYTQADKSSIDTMIP